MYEMSCPLPPGGECGSGGVWWDVSIKVMDILNIQISMSKCRWLTRPTPRFQGSFAFRLDGMPVHRKVLPSIVCLPEQFSCSYLFMLHGVERPRQ